MKIAIDLRSLSEGRRSGVEEYILNVVSYLLYIDPHNAYVLFKSGVKDWQFTRELARYQNNSAIEKRLKIPNRILNLSLKIFREPLLDAVSGKPDIFFMPNINIGPLSSRGKKIITFHDLSYEVYPEYFSLKRRLWHTFINPKKQAWEAHKIIAISESTKNDLINIYRIPSEKIKVVYSGINQKFQPIFWNDLRLKKVKEKYKLPDRFILYLGTIEPRKNIVGLIKAFELLKEDKKETEDLRLAIAGIKGWLYDEIIETAKMSLYRKDIFFTGFIDDEDKLFVYNLAEVFIYPSFYEGFGFPPLEAMACGIPTITSNVSSLPEAVGNGAIMVDPYNIDEIAESIQLCVSDKELRNTLREKGLAQARKFSWIKTAKQILDLITTR